MSAGGDLDQLRKTISDLSYWQSAQEGEIEEGVDWSMISSKSILLVAMIDSNLDGGRCINQPDHSRWDSNEIGSASVRRTHKPGSVCDKATPDDKD